MQCVVGSGGFAPRRKGGRWLSADSIEAYRGFASGYRALHNLEAYI
jgi:hypothetical protein